MTPTDPLHRAMLDAGLLAAAQPAGFTDISGTPANPANIAAPATAEDKTRAMVARVLDDTDAPLVQMSRTAYDAALAQAREDGMRAAVTHRHVKRGTEYSHIGSARIQSDVPLNDMDRVEVYWGHGDDDLWARRQCEFHDGRFAALTRAPAVPVGALVETTQWARNRLEAIADESWRGDARDFKRALIGIFADFDDALAACGSKIPNAITALRARQTPAPVPPARQSEESP